MDIILFVFSKNSSEDVCSIKRRTVRTFFICTIMSIWRRRRKNLRHRLRRHFRLPRSTVHQWFSHRIDDENKTWIDLSVFFSFFNGLERFFFKAFIHIIVQILVSVFYLYVHFSCSNAGTLKRIFWGTAYVLFRWKKRLSGCFFVCGETIDCTKLDEEALKIPLWVTVGIFLRLLKSLSKYIWEAYLIPVIGTASSFSSIFFNFRLLLRVPVNIIKIDCNWLIMIMYFWCETFHACLSSKQCFFLIKISFEESTGLIKFSESKSCIIQRTVKLSFVGLVRSFEFCFEWKMQSICENEFEAGL